MKRYFVFFANTINRVGGAQLYIKSKALFMKKNGWVIKIIYHQDGDLIINELKNFDSLMCPNIYKPSYMYTTRKREDIVENISEFIYSDNTEFVFESHSRTLASWAEIVAKRLGNVKHICFDLDECISIPSPMLDFYKFKYDRHELYGIQEESINILFKDTGFNLYYGSPRLQAYGASDSVMECQTDINVDEFNGYKIGVVGRLEKAYVWEYAQAVKQFVENHPLQQFTIIFVGGAPEKDNPQKKIIQLFKHTTNIKLFFTGYLFPIPQIVVRAFDVCLAGAGAASAIRREGIITITIDPRDNLSNGVLGVTTQNSTFSKGEKHPVIWWLDSVYNNPQNYNVSQIGYNYDFSSHLEVIENSTNIVEYDTSFLEYRFSYLDYTKRFINSILPIAAREKLAAFIRRIQLNYQM